MKQNHNTQHLTIHKDNHYKIQQTIVEVGCWETLRKKTVFNSSIIGISRAWTTFVSISDAFRLCGTHRIRDLVFATLSRDRRNL